MQKRRSGKWFPAMAVLFFVSGTISPFICKMTCAANENTGKYEIQLKSRHFTPAEDRKAALRAPAADEGSQARIHVLMQFRYKPDSATRDLLSKVGVKLFNYLPKNCWFASIPAGLDPDLPALSTVRWIGNILPEDKLSPALLDSVSGDGALVEGGKVSLNVKYFADADQTALRSRVEGLPVIVLGESPLLKSMTLSLAPESILTIAGDDAVRWMEPVGSGPQPESDRVRSHIQADLTQNTGLTGSGIRVGVFEDGHVSKWHPDLYPRVATPDWGAGYTPAWHATNVAGIIGGNGSQSLGEFGTAYQWIGMAPGAEIYSYDFGSGNDTNFTNDLADAVHTYAIHIANNSWGDSSCTTYGEYIDLCPFLDDVVHGGHTYPFGGRLPIVFSVGNDRDGYGSGNNLGCSIFVDKSAPFENYGTINQPKAAKNIITVGAVDSQNNAMTAYSSWGPTADGRIKPDIVASGHHAGSMSSGVSSGINTSCRLGGSSYVTPTYDDVTPISGTHTGSNNQDYLKDSNLSFAGNALVGFILTKTTSGDSCIINSNSRWGDVFCKPGTTITWDNNDAYTIDRKYGCFGQTSNAAAATSGAIALLLEDYYDFNVDWPLSSTIKALLTHTAQDLNDSARSWYNKGPDYASGYGLLRIQDAILHRKTHGFIENTIWYRPTHLTWPQQMHYRFNVPANTPSVKVTLVWDDEPGAENASYPLVNDLDLILHDPNGGIHFPWTLDPGNPENPAVRTTSDHTNNLEQVLVDSSITSGSWEAIVIGTEINDADGYQEFSLVGQTFTPSLNCDHAKALTLDVPYSSYTSTSDESNVYSYPPFLLSMDGPEAVHQITTTCQGDLSVELTNTTGALWVFLLSSCDPRDTLDWAANYWLSPVAQYKNAPTGTYTIVVDGPAGQSGQYTLTASLDGCKVSGDFDDDGDNDGVDLSELAGEFGWNCGPDGCVTDLSGDGVVNSEDLAIYAVGFGWIQ